MTKKDSKGTGFTDIITGLFLMLCTVVGCFFLWEELSGDEISWVNAGGGAALCLLFFFAALSKLTGSLSFARLFFMTMGMAFIALSGGIIWNISLPDMQTILETRHWQEAACTIISSSTASERSESGAYIYNPEIRYHYKIDGHGYESRTVDVYWVSSLGDPDKIVKKYPAGRETVCFVNPADFEQSCLQKGFQPMHAVLFMPLIITALGMVFIVAAFWPNS